MGIFFKFEEVEIRTKWNIKKTHVTKVVSCWSSRKHLLISDSYLRNSVRSPSRLLATATTKVSRLSHTIRFEEVQRHFILFLSVIDRFWRVFLHISVSLFFLVNFFSVISSFNFLCKSIHDYLCSPRKSKQLAQQATLSILKATSGNKIVNFFLVLTSYI